MRLLELAVVTGGLVLGVCSSAGASPATAHRTTTVDGITYVDLPPGVTPVPGWNRAVTRGLKDPGPGAVGSTSKVPVTPPGPLPR
jgi:hypothetical protein